MGKPTKKTNSGPLAKSSKQKGGKPAPKPAPSKKKQTPPAPAVKKNSKSKSKAAGAKGSGKGTMGGVGSSSDDDDDDVEDSPSDVPSEDADSNEETSDAPAVSKGKKASGGKKKNLPPPAQKQKKKDPKSERKQPTTIMARNETAVEWKYSGGTNLAAFKQEFKAAAYLNEWSDEMAIYKLRGLMAGTARAFVDTLMDDYGELLEVDDVLKRLELEFVTPSAKAMAEAKVESLKRRDGESAVDFGARWLRAWKAAGQKNDESAAVKFFKLCSSQGYGEGLVYSRMLYKSVNAVAEALEGVEMTELWRGSHFGGKRKRSKVPEDESDSSAASGSDEPQRGRRSGKSKRKVEEPTLSVQQLDVMAVAAVERAAAGHKPKAPEPFSASDSKPPLSCQLCGKGGHAADDCRNPRCSKCMFHGHIAACCPYANGECFGCGQMGHLLTNCPSKRGGGGFRGRGRGRGQFGGSSRFSGDCYNCGQPGHLARNCQAQSKPSGVKQETGVQALTVEQVAAIALSVQSAAAQREEKTKEREKAGAAGGAARHPK